MLWRCLGECATCSSPWKRCEGMKKGWGVGDVSRFTLRLEVRRAKSDHWRRMSQPMTAAGARLVEAAQE